MLNLARILKLVFKDRGIPYNPLAKEDPDITQKLEDRAIGGMGIFLTKQYMDNISYNYTDGKNKRSELR